MAEIVDPFKQNPSQPNTQGIVDPFAGPSPAASEVDKSKQIERSWGQALGDTALGVAAGAANLVGGLVETREATKPTNIARQGLRLLDRAGVPGASSLAAKVPRTLTERQFGMAPGAGSAATSKGIQMMSDAIGSAQSDALQQEKQELAETEGFVGSAKKVLTSPRLLGNFVAEQVPNIATMGVGTRLAAARAGQRALGGALAKGLSMEAAETAAAAAGKKAATTAATSMTTVMEAGQAGQQTYQQAMAQPQSVWDANPEYQRMIAAGADPVTAKETIARGASLQAQAITAPIAAVAGRIAAPFEADVFTRQLARRPMAMLQGAARETVEEMIQEGGSQFSGNVAQRQVDPNQGVWEGVPEAAGIGAALGAVLGGGMSAGGALASERRGAKAESDRGLPPNAPQDDLLALPAPAPTVVSPDGTATTASQAYAQQQADVAFSAQRDAAGLSPDVNAARTAHPGAAPNAPADMPLSVTRALPAPTAPGAPFAVDADGVAVTPQQAFDAEGAQLREAQERQAADIAFAQQRSDMGLTPDVNRARARHPAAAPALPDGSPVPDPARGVLSRAVNIGVANGAVQRAAEEQAIAQAEAVAEQERKAGGQKAVRQPDMFDMDPATGEVVVSPPAPTADDLRGRLDYLRQQAKQSGWSQRLVEERRSVERELRAATGGEVRQEAPAVEAPALAGPVPAVQAAETPAGPAVPAAAEMSASRAANAAVTAPEAPAAEGSLRSSESAVRTPGTAARTGEVAPSTQQAGSQNPAVAAGSALPNDSTAAPAYDTSEEMQDADIGAPSGGPFTIKDAAQRVAARTNGGQVFPVDGGFVVRTPQAATAPAPTAIAPPAPTGVVDAAAADAATSPTNDLPAPTEAQKEAGNYKKGHARVAGLDISIENPAGSRRRPEWPPLQNHYGYFKGTTGADKDHVDVFLTERAEDESLPVFVVDQVNKDGSFDEHKVVMGAPDEASARAAYLSNYEKGWQGLGAITQMAQDEFKAWVKDPAKTVKPAAQVPTETAAPALSAVQDQPPTAGNEGRGAQPTNPVHSALRRIAGGVHPELTLSGMDAGDIRAVGEAMGRKFSPRASSAAIAERLGEVARADWKAAAQRAVEKLSAESKIDSDQAAPAKPAKRGKSAPPAGAAPAQSTINSPAAGSGQYTPRVRTVKGELRYDASDIGTLGAYFQPGRVVSSYGGQDRVIEFRPADTGRWSVNVQAIDADGNAVPEEGPRWHSTLPSTKELVAVLGQPSKPARKAATKAERAGSRSATASAIHSDPGQPTEPATAEVIEKSIEKSAAKTPRTPKGARALLLGKIDAAIAAAPTLASLGLGEAPTPRRGETTSSFEQRRADYVKAAGYVSLDVPGDGSFRVVNTKERLAEFRSEVEKSQGFSERATRPVGPRPASTSMPESQRAAVMAEAEAVDDGEVSPGTAAAPSDLKFSRPNTDQSDSPAFRRWFGDSKVVDEQGRPLVVYHGTNANFERFDQERLGEASEHPSAVLGFYFTSNSTVAEEWAWSEDDGHVMPVYLAIANPMQMTGEEFRGMVDGHARTDRQMRQLFTALKKTAESRGYDGIYVSKIDGPLREEDAEWSSDVYIAFRPEQIKSATDNTGTFDPRNPDIRFSRPDGGSSAGLSVEQVRKATDRATAGWRGDAPKVQVVQHAAELPARAKVDPEHATAEGFYDEADGTVYLVADNLRSPRRALQVLAHEAVGHYGIEAITGPELWAQVGQAVEKMRASGRHAELFAEIDRRYRGANRDIAVREALAVMAEKGTSSNVLDRVVAAVRRFLRQLGFQVEFSEAELRQHLAAAARYVRGGSRPRQAAAAGNAELAFSRTDIDPDREVPVVSLAGGIFGDTARDAAGARRRARDYLKKLRDSGNLMTNDDTGWKIGLSGKGINELASWHPAKLNLIAALPRITRIAVLARTEANAEVSVANPAGESVLAYHTFYAPVRMNGELRLARLVVQEQKGGRYAYDLQQSGLVEERSPAEPARIPGHIRGASQTQAGLTAMTVAQLRDAVNAVDRPGWKWSKADSAAGDAFARWFGGSQVVTGDGQPKVVYHGTADGFWSFDKGRLSESTGHMSAPLGFFFAEDRASAEGYARLAADGVPADERVVDAFLSIQHPFRMTVADLMQIESKDEAAALRMVMQRQGYDGIHVTDAGKGQWIAFEPEQIKSATENVGTFDRASSDLRFSKPDPTAVIDAIDERGRGVGEGIAARLKDMFRGLKPENLRENTRPAWLGALTLRHLAELGGDLKLRQVGEYADLVQRMATARNVMQETVSGTADSWEKFQRKDRAGADATANLMHDTTIEGVDPSKDYEPLRTGTTKRGPDEAVTRESIARRKAAVVQEMAQAGSPAARARLDAEAKRLDELLAQEQRRRDQYPTLVRRFLALPDAGQKLYREVRDAYEKQSERMEDALVARIDALEIDGKQKAAMVAQVRQHFESARVNGPYFPLQRFGQFWISAESPAGEPAFMMYERVESWREAQRELQARGFKIKNAGRKLDEARGLAGASGGFMADLQGLLETSGVDKDTRDEVYQLYLRTLPDLSVRKHQIHRKATAGYSNDALRAFSSNMFHGSFQVARLRHSHELDAALLDMKAAVETMTGSDPERAAKAAALYSEMNKRHEWVMNPRDSKGVSSLTSIGFAWYLGATPAAALVNLTQTAIVSYPVLAARFGAGKAFTMLSSATGQALRNATGDITRSLTQEERAAYQLWREAGTIDKSQAHNLAGLSETDTRAFNPWARRAMEVISWGFHRTEVVNREATALAAFRLARESGQSFNDAVKYAGEVVTESHFDYSNANRARWMQSNAAKVLLLFRQYSLNMTWFLWRNLYQSLKGEAPEVRKEARAKLAGVLGMTGVFAGAMGMPLMSVMFGLAEAAAAAFGDDDDEPFDAEVAFRNFLADMLGPDVARILAKGPVDYFTGASVGSRVSLNDLWLREPNRELEGQAQADYLLEQAAGPLFGGMLVNTLRGMKQIGDGHTWRGIETMMPKSIKDGMKSVRYATQGVNTLKGDPVIDDLGVGGALLQLAGFSPASLSERYEGINAAKNFEEKLLGRRSALLNAYAMAWRAGDADTVGKVVEKMRAFNQAQPALAINSETIRQSLQARLRYSSRAEGGVVLNPKVAAQAREQARFAE